MRVRRGAALLLLTYVLLAGCGSSEETEATTTTTTEPAGVAVDDLVAGDCLSQVPAGPSERVETVPCATEHRAEVYAVFDLEQSDQTEAATVSEDAALGCADRYAAYAGEPIDPTTDRAFSELVPSEESPSDGDRGVVCLVLPPGGAVAPGSIADGSATTGAP